MRISPKDFEQMTPVEFVYAWIMWADYEEDKMRGEWERERWSTYALLAIQIECNKLPPSTEMLPLSWDEKSKEPIQISMEQRLESVAEMMKQIDINRKGDL